jgi:hypothetical protein
MTIRRVVGIGLLRQDTSRHGSTPSTCSPRQHARLPGAGQTTPRVQGAIQLGSTARQTRNGRPTSRRRCGRVSARLKSGRRHHRSGGATLRGRPVGASEFPWASRTLIDETGRCLWPAWRSLLPWCHESESEFDPRPLAHFGLSPRRHRPGGWWRPEHVGESTGRQGITPAASF